MWDILRGNSKITFALNNKKENAEFDNLISKKVEYIKIFFININKIKLIRDWVK